MTAITLPNSIESACQELSNDKKHVNAVNHFLKTEQVADQVREHKKAFPDVHIKEYTTTLNTLFSFYHAGQPVSVNDLLDKTTTQLDEYFESRRLSRNSIRDSFIPLLKNLGLITGERPMIWAYLDTPPSQFQNLKVMAKKFYQSNIEKTDAEIKLDQSRREQKALKQLEQMTLANRNLQDDIKNDLDYLKKLDNDCKKLAYELNVPYSKVREDALNKRKSVDSAAAVKKYGFIGLIALVLIMGFMSDRNESSHVTTEDEVSYYMESDEAPSEINDESPNTVTTDPMNLQLSIGEEIWRARYVDLYKQNNGVTQASEDELILLASEYNITNERLTTIIKTITTTEVSN